MIRSTLNVYRQAFSGLPRVVWALALVMLVNRAGMMVLPFLVVYLTEVLHFSPSDAGEALMLYGLGSCLGAFVGGWLADRLGPRRVMLTSLAGAGLGFIVLGHMRTPQGILVTVFVVGLINDALRPAGNAAVAEACPPELMRKAFALMRLAVNAGMTVGPAVGGFLAEHDFGLIFVVDGLTCWLAAILLGWRVHGLDQPHAARVAAGAGARGPLRDRTFLMVIVLMTASAALFLQIFGTYPLFLRESYHLAKSTIGVVLAVNTLVIVAFEMILVHRLGRFLELHMVGLGCALIGIGFAMLPLGSGVAWAVLSVLIWTCGEMLLGPMSAGYVGRRAPPGARGRYMALYTLVWGVGNMAGSFFGTRVYEFQGPTVLWIGCGALGVLLWPAFSALARR